MEDIIRKVFLAGIGAVSLSYEKSKELLDHLISEGRLSLEEGKRLNQELKRSMDSKSKEEIDRFREDLNLASKDDLEKILERLDRLEEKNE